MEDYKHNDKLDNYNETYEKPFMRDYRLYTLFKNIDLKDKVILDCPSSTGYLSKKFIDKGARHVICIDIVEEQLHYADIFFKNNQIDQNKYTLLCHDAKVATKINSKYEIDMIICLHLFCFSNNIDDLHNMCKFFFINLKKGGKMYSYHCCPFKENFNKHEYEQNNNVTLQEYRKINESWYYVHTIENDFNLIRNALPNKDVMDALLHVGFSNIRLIKMESCPNAKDKVMLDKQQDYLDQYFIECEKI